MLNSTANISKIDVDFEKFNMSYDNLRQSHSIIIQLDFFEFCIYHFTKEFFVSKRNIF